MLARNGHMRSAAARACGPTSPTAAPASQEVPGALLRFDDERAETAWREGFHRGVRSLDLGYAVWNFAADFVSTRRPALRASPALMTASSVALALDLVMLYAQLRHYATFARRRGWFVAAARLGRLGEPPPARMLTCLGVRR
jgi:hypothetical protein